LKDQNARRTTFFFPFRSNVPDIHLRLLGLVDASLFLASPAAPLARRERGSCRSIRDAGNHIRSYIRFAYSWAINPRNSCSAVGRVGLESTVPTIKNLLTFAFGGQKPADSLRVEGTGQRCLATRAVRRH
jgi:hypothetical protein